MTIQHRLITDAERHEPKGITTAPAGTVYVANGDTLSGAWEIPQIEGQDAALNGMIPKVNLAGNIEWKYMPVGWVFYQGDATQTFTTTPSKLLINGLGAFTREDYAPIEIRGTVNKLFDVATSKITPIAEGDSYDLRLDLNITSETGSPTEIKFVLDIGATAGITTPVVTTFAPTGRTTPYSLTISFPIFCLDRFMANGGQIFLSTDVGTVATTTNSLTLSRNSAGDF